MLTQAENERITRVGRETPMGEVFRRYWLPAALSAEVPERDGAPVRVRLLGEDLLAFRDSDGKVGLVDAFCPHRRAPLFFGRNEERGLRCVYHGWKFDRKGSCVDMPSEPPDSLFRTKVTLTAYPTHEAGGFVWAYLGPPQTRPLPPDYELCRVPPTHRFVSKTLERCNYLQALEGGMDGTHAGFLHGTTNGDLRYLRDFEALVPRIDVVSTDYGYHYSANRILGDRQWVRINHYVMPTTQLRGSMEGTFHLAGDPQLVDGHIWVPIDDERCFVYNFGYSADPDVPIPAETALELERRFGRGPDEVLPDFSLRLHAGNDYRVDRAAQKAGSFTGIRGLNTQDIAIQEGMGPICDRTKEHLGTTDRPIIILRRLLLEAADVVAAGGMPLGAEPRAARLVRPADRLIPLGRPWQEAIPDALIARF